MAAYLPGHSRGTGFTAGARAPARPPLAPPLFVRDTESAVRLNWKHQQSQGGISGEE